MNSMRAELWNSIELPEPEFESLDNFHLHRACSLITEIVFIPVWGRCGSYIWKAL